MLDTGATLNVISYGSWRRLGLEKFDLQETKIKIITANVQPMQILGITPTLSIDIAGYTLNVSFKVVDFLAADEFISKRSFIRAHGVLIDVNEQKTVIRSPEGIEPGREEQIASNNKKCQYFLRKL